MAESRVGIRAAAALIGVNCVPIYVAAAKRLIPTEVSPGGKVLFKVADLTAWKNEETLRKARRDREKRDAARRVGEIMARRRKT